MRIHACFCGLCLLQKRITLEACLEWELENFYSAIQSSNYARLNKAQRRARTDFLGSRVLAFLLAMQDSARSTVAWPVRQTHRTLRARRVNRSSQTDWLNPHPKWFSRRKFVCTGIESIKRLTPTFVIFGRSVKWTSLRLKPGSALRTCSTLLQTLVSSGSCFDFLTDHFRSSFISALIPIVCSGTSSAMNDDASLEIMNNYIFVRS